MQVIIKKCEKLITKYDLGTSRITKGKIFSLKYNIYFVLFQK